MGDRATHANEEPSLWATSRAWRGRVILIRAAPRPVSSSQARPVRSYACLRVPSVLSSLAWVAVRDKRARCAWLALEGCGGSG